MRRHRPRDPLSAVLWGLILLAVVISGGFMAGYAADAVIRTTQHIVCADVCETVIEE